MPVPKKFNIRVYGIWIHNDRVLVNEELIQGNTVIKFPGGGLHLGEGVLDCLKREWAEELGLEIEILDHFYTTDYFQHSAYDDSQVISIYYLVMALNEPEVITNLMENERTFWMPAEDVSAETFTLAIDRKVGGMLQQLFNDQSGNN